MSGPIINPAITSSKATDSPDEISDNDITSEFQICPSIGVGYVW